MKHSIRMKLLILILVAIVSPVLILGVTSFFTTESLTDEYAHQYVSLICEKNAAEINAIFKPLEQSVDYMSINAMEELSNPMNLMDEIYYDNYVSKMQSILLNTSKHTEAVVSVYLRLNPEQYGPTAGLFMTREKAGTELKSSIPTDLSVYTESDVEHVGWYYQPINAGHAVWMLPYYNRNTDVYMISYVVPLFKNETTVGVLGMDIDFSHITDRVKNISLYKSGYAYITDAEGKVIYHPRLNYGESVPDKKGWWSSSCSLDNGMILYITAPVNEINASRDSLIRIIFVSAAALVIIFAMITIMVTRKMTAPLHKLNEIANEITNSNYDVDFDFERPNDEIGQLITSFETTVETLKEYTTYLNGLAYKDSLTAVRNRMAYDYQVSVLEDAWKNGEDLSIAIAVFDVNNLKYVNDNLGHEKGDILLQNACKMICHTFNHSPVFRIGGDEFVAIIKDANDEEIEEILSRFVQNMEETWSNEEPELRVSIAYGVARYDDTLDQKQAEALFKRADEIMYANKKVMKEKQRSHLTTE